jgi:hypothetical protein
MISLQSVTPEQELQRAREAQRLLDDPLFKAARENLEGQLTQLRRDVPIGQTEMHTRLILMGQIADRFFGYFEQIAQTGLLAQVHLDDLEKRRRTLSQRLQSYAQWGRNAL